MPSLPLLVIVQLQVPVYKEVVEVCLDMYRLLCCNSYMGACLHRIRVHGSQQLYVSSINYSLTNEKPEELE